MGKCFPGPSFKTLTTTFLAKIFPSVLTTTSCLPLEEVQPTTLYLFLLWRICIAVSHQLSVFSDRVP